MNRRSRAARSNRPATRRAADANMTANVIEHPRRRGTDEAFPTKVRRPQQRLLSRLFKLITDWRFFTLVGLALTGGLTALSIAFIFKMPAVPNCPAVFWPLASASLRLHCAQLAANKETVPDLLEAIKLLNTLGEEHPLYPEASRLIEAWSTQILDLAEADFQAGNIKAAIARRVRFPKSRQRPSWSISESSSGRAFGQKPKQFMAKSRDYSKRPNWLRRK
ncbi:MAG: hypothetical protein HC805_08345 [Alkalinema sp. RL_2_19]|nr:hypothetical protein [Alkalinema sp. RL_2_19]